METLVLVESEKFDVYVQRPKEADTCTCHDSTLLQEQSNILRVGRGWRIGRVDAFRSKGHGFDSRSSRHVGTLDKSSTHSCRWHFGVKSRHIIRAVSGAPPRSNGLEEVQ